MEDIIRMKHSLLDKHIEFVVKMLTKFKNTKFQNHWQHMYDCITSDRKKMSVEQIHKLSSKLMEYEIRFQPVSKQTENLAENRFANSSRNKSPPRDPRNRNRSPIRFPLNGQHPADSNLPSYVKNFRTNHHQASASFDHSGDHASRDPRLNRLIGSDASHFQKRSESPRDRQKSFETLVITSGYGEDPRGHGSRLSSSSRDSPVDCRQQESNQTYGSNRERFHSRPRSRYSPQPRSERSPPRQRSHSRSQKYSENRDRSRNWDVRSSNKRARSPSREYSNTSSRRSPPMDFCEVKSPPRSRFAKGRRYSRSPSPKAYHQHKLLQVPPRRVPTSCYQPKPTKPEETFRRVEQFTEKRVPERHHEFPQRKPPQRRMSCHQPNPGESFMSVPAQQSNLPNEQPKRKLPQRRMSCYPSSIKEKAADTCDESLIKARLRLLDANVVQSSIKLPETFLPEPVLSSEVKRCHLSSPTLDSETVFCQASEDFLHPKFVEGPKQKPVSVEDRQATEPKLLENNSLATKPTVAVTANSIQSFKIPRLKPATSLIESCETVSQDSTPSISSGESALEELKNSDESHLPKKEAAPEELVKDLEKVLGRKVLLLKLTSLLVQDPVPKQVENETLSAHKTSASIEKEQTVEKSSVSLSPVTDCKRKVSESKSEIIEVANKSTAQKPKVQQTVTKSTSKVKLVHNKQPAMKEAAKPSSSKLQSNKQEAKQSSKKEEVKMKNSANTAPSKREKVIEKQASVKQTLKKKDEVKTVSPKPSLKETKTRSSREVAPVEKHKEKSSVAAHINKVPPGSNKGKKPARNELDRLHFDINRCFDKDGIVHAVGPRTCTITTKDKPVVPVSDDEYIKKFNIVDRCEVTLKRLDLSGEQMPVLINRHFVSKHPELQKELDSYLDSIEEDNMSVGSSEDSIALNDNEEKEHQPQPAATPKKGTPDRKQDVNVPTVDMTIKSSSKSSTVKAVANRKRGNWSNGIIVKRSRKQKAPAPNVDDEWEDVPEESPATTEVQRIVNLKRLVKFMSSFDKKVAKDVKPSEQSPGPSTGPEPNIVSATTLPNIPCTMSAADNQINCELCSFGSAQKETFLQHIKSKHPQITWKNSCKMCDKMIESSEDTLESKFNHMLTHMETSHSDDLLQEIPAPPFRPMLKIRSLPGDKLSTVLKSAHPEEAPHVQMTPPKPSAVVKPRISTSDEDFRPKNIPKASPKFINLLLVSPTSSAFSTKSTENLTKIPSASPIALKFSAATSKQLIEPASIVSITSQATSNLQQSMLKSDNTDSAKVISNFQNMTLTQTTPTSFSVKMSQSKPAEVETIQNADAVTSNILRPWISCANDNKSSKAAAEMSNNHNCLAALFKCMGSTCSFFTSEKVLFQKHLQLHGKHQSEDRSNFLTCPYCSKCYAHQHQAEDAIPLLLNHIMVNHAYDKFQCGYCFYRALSDFHVFHQHQNLYHKDKKKVVIECDLAYKKNKNKEMQKIKKVIPIIIPHIKCIVCMIPFYVFDLYKKHVESHQEKVTYTCKKCHEVLTEVDAIIEHLCSCFGFGLFQCVYCRFGSNDFAKIDDHIAEKHSSQLPVFCERVASASSQKIDPASISSMAIKIVAKSSMLCVKFKVEEKKLINKSKVEFLGLDAEQHKFVSSEESEEPSAIQIIDSEEELQSSAIPEPEKSTKTQALQIRNVVSLFGMPAKSLDLDETGDLEFVEFNSRKYDDCKTYQGCEKKN